MVNQISGLSAARKVRLVSPPSLSPESFKVGVVTTSGQWLKLLRPRQYIKNGFVLIGLLFGGPWNVSTLSQAGIAFLAFCAIASAAYVVNDIFDVEADREHPTKCNRPIASGAISIKKGWMIACALTVLALALSSWISPWATMLIVIYALLNLGYSLRWKHIAVIDVFIISAGFMLRILIGTVGLGIAPSSWLLLCGVMLTLFLGFAKRRSELMMIQRQGVERLGIECGKKTRKVLDDYSPEMIEQFMSISAAGTILSYSLYTVSPETVTKHHTNLLIVTVPFVIYGMFRYLYLLHKEGGGNDTAKDLMTDPHLLATTTAWILLTIGILL